jgi:predicted CXXCH cytochrome family protein
MKFGRDKIFYATAVLTVILYYSCAVESHQKTLSIFFDGVNESTQVNNIARKDSLKNGNTRSTSDADKKSSLFFHKPFAERKCELCHTEDRHLVKQTPELCYLCHTDFKNSYKNIHGPVASGECLNCHNQHSSQYSKLLNRAGQQLCIYCHSPNQIYRNKSHIDIEDADCTLCHNPHGSNGKYLVKEGIQNMKKEFVEISSKHLFGQITTEADSSINLGGIEITITDNAGGYIYSCITDAYGKFAIRNVHPDLNYFFVINKKLNKAKINIISSRNELLQTLDKSDKNKYVFDKNTYARAHWALLKTENKND